MSSKERLKLQDICRLAYKPRDIPVKQEVKQEDKKDAPSSSTSKKETKPISIDVPVDMDISSSESSSKQLKTDSKCQPVEKCRTEVDPDIQKLPKDAPLYKFHQLCRTIAGKMAYQGNVATVWEYGSAAHADPKLIEYPGVSQFLTPRAQTFFAQALSVIRGLQPKITVAQICDSLDYSVAFAGLCTAYKNLADSNTIKPFVSGTVKAQHRDANGQDIQQFLQVFHPVQARSKKRR